MCSTNTFTKSETSPGVGSKDEEHAASSSRGGAIDTQPHNLLSKFNHEFPQGVGLEIQ